jgi:hypothetical protein
LEALSSGEGLAAPRASLALSAPSLRPEPLLPAVPRTFPVRSSSSGGGTSSLKVDPSRVIASKPFSASLAVSQLTASPSSGATEMGEKLCFSPSVVSKPFQSYIRKARVLREGVSLKWNDVLLSDSLKASKKVADLAVNKVSVAEPPAIKGAEPPVKKGFLRKGFLNPRPDIPATPTSPRKVFDGTSLPPLLEVAPFLHPLRVMDSPNLEIGRSVLIIMGRLWFGRKLIFGMFCLWIERQRVL